MNASKLIANHATSMSLAALLMSTPQFAQAYGEIVASEAASCVGRVCTVEGLVANVVTAKDKSTVIKLDGPSPSQAFSAVILADASSQFQSLENYEGRWVRITGLIKMHKGTPEAVLVHPSQLIPAD